MDISALLQVSHRSVHWAQLAKLRESSIKTNSYGEWKKLLTLQICTKLPHIFSKALDFSLKATLTGHIEIREFTIGLGQIIAPINGQRQVDENIEMQVVGALVSLVVNGANNVARNSREHILKPILERSPSLWTAILECIGGRLSDEFAHSWDSLQTVLQMGIVDPTVPAWAQRVAVNCVFDVANELIYKNCLNEAIEVLIWTTDLAAHMVQPVNGNQEGYIAVDTCGRISSQHLLALCTRMVERLTASTPMHPQLGSVVNQLQLLAASLLFVDIEQADIKYVQSQWWTSNKAEAAQLLVRLLNVAQKLNVVEKVHAVVWMVIAHRLNNASSAEEQQTLLCGIQSILNQEQLSEDIAILMHMPLLATVADGFTSAISSKAQSIISQLKGSEASTNSEIALSLDKLNADMGALPLAVDLLQRYIRACAAATMGDAKQVLEEVRGHILLIAPLLFAWHYDVAVPTSAIAVLLAQLQRHPRHALHILVLFANALQRKDTPATLRHMLLLRGVPGVITTGDAFVTARAVKLVGNIWSRAQREGSGRVAALAVRAWSYIAQRNSRVWREMHSIVVQMAEAHKAHKEQDAAYIWAVLTIVNDMMRMDAQRFADDILPLAHSLLRFGTMDGVCAALLVETVRLAVEAEVVDVRSAWAIVEQPHQPWWDAEPATSEIAHMAACVGKFGELTATYATFRQRVLAEVVAMRAFEGDKLKHHGFANAMAAFPVEEVQPLLHGQLSVLTHELTCSNGAPLLASLMDDEVRMMRRTALRGSRVARATEAAAPASWAHANATRCRWLRNVFEFPLQRTREQQKNGARSTSSLTALVDTRSEQPLEALIGSSVLSDHWTLRCVAVNAWHIRFSSSNTAQQVDYQAVLHTLHGELSKNPDPAYIADILFAIAGLTRSAAQSADAAELSLRAKIILEKEGLALSSDGLWDMSPAVVGAALECAAHIACANVHDTEMLGVTTQLLMEAVSDRSLLSIEAAIGAARALARVFSVLAAQQRRTISDSIEAEADDVRRCVERLDVLHSKRANAGGAAMAMTLALMHRHWIMRAIDPAHVDTNSDPHAAAAIRSVTNTLSEAMKLLQAGGEPDQWHPSLFYLCFVWPPRPITSRLVELHPTLFTVTPDRVWRLCMREIISSKPGVAEIAVATLAHHQLLTAGQRGHHERIMQEYAEWVRGNTLGDWAADQVQVVRAGKVAALGVLMGVPLHGVPETTISNRHLPIAQRLHAPMLLSVGPVQYGSTAWLRIGEPMLHEALGSLLACAGLSDEDQTEEVLLEVGDVRAARIAGFITAVLDAQVAQAEHMLSDNVPENASELQDVDDENCIAAADAEQGEEPQSLAHLPAQTSWCRAVWESISELADLVLAPQVPDAVESQLTCLLTALKLAERPFPSVCMRPVLRRIVDACLTTSSRELNRPMPLLMLVIDVAYKLSPVMYSMAQFLDDVLLLIVQKVRAISSIDGPAWHVDTINEGSLLSIALQCMGERGLGRMLGLCGLVPCIGSLDSGHGCTQSIAPDAKFVYSDLVRLIGTSALFSKHELESAAAVSRKIPRKQNEAESDGERMFRLMSKVVVAAPKVVALCTQLLEVLFAQPKIRHSALLAVRLQLLATLYAHITNVDSVDQNEHARELARSKISDLVSSCVISWSLSLPDQVERRWLLWGAAGVAGSGANEAWGRELLSRDMQDLGDGKLCELLELQSAVLQHWMMTATRPMSPRSCAGDWLKKVFKEWARRTASAGVGKTACECLQQVACTMHSLNAITNERQMREWIVHSLDLVILAASMIRDNKPAMHQILCAALVSWLLPLLTGYSAASSQGQLQLVVGNELVEHIEEEAAESSHKMRPYSALLRSRVIGLLDLISDKDAGWLQHILAHLAILGRLPATEIWRVIY
ncbi:hypothetical protein IWW36_001370 [Coemansia brasiliensis]|uniref:Uncharacterized protein n=1 Tax=Coemansia brasiliensis TaxID=2650707 RepID=A0A9W8M1M0_9FUNG|nr:hypothetical protein IWW36_001370 [Coemansia brasiliensis]